MNRGDRSPPTAVRLPAVLIYREGTADERTIPFNGDTMTIGRGQACELAIRVDEKVARGHCRLRRCGASIFIEDSRSGCGTLVNQELIGVGPRQLQDGDVITVGESPVRFRIHG